MDREVVDRFEELAVMMSGSLMRDCAASNTSSTIVQSSSVIPVSMAGSLYTGHPLIR